MDGLEPGVVFFATGFTTGGEVFSTTGFGGDGFSGDGARLSSCRGAADRSDSCVISVAG